METVHLLKLVLVLLAAIVIAVPLAARFRLGAVLGYLLAGVVIGPAGFDLVGDPARIGAISEFGVVLMLFVIGLELSPRRLWVMRRYVFGTGLLQVLCCALALGLCAYALGGLGPHAALVVGGSLALSSTAFGLQILTERKEAGTAYGRQAFSVLLFQDLAAIPLIAAVPLLAVDSSGAPTPPGSAWRTALVILAVIVGGRYLLRPLFRFVAKTRLPEVSTAMALLVVVGTAWLMEMGHISNTLGAFLAGMLLADSEYRHELESHLEPFKGLLLGLFFISVGMAMQLSLLVQHPLWIFAIVLGLLVVKSLLLWPLGYWVGGLKSSDAWRLAALLACGGEFAFVVLRLGLDQGLINRLQHDALVLAITLSAALMPLLVLLVSRLLARGAAKPERREFDVIDAATPRVIIAGFGRMGQIVGRVLSAQKIPFVALESSIDQVDDSRRFGSAELFFGDPARIDLLRAAQADKAEVFVLTTDDPEANLRIAAVVRREFPQLKIIARARNRQHAFRQLNMGIKAPIRETFYSSLKMTRMTLEALGLSSALAADRAERFRRHDEEVLRRQAQWIDDESQLIQSVHEAWSDLQQLFEADAEPRAERERAEGAMQPE